MMLHYTARELAFSLRMCLGLLAVLLPIQTMAAELNQTSFERLQEQLQPQGSELWRSIPWRTDLLAAQAAAARTDKPLFIWAMDGHPLGCT